MKIFIICGKARAGKDTFCSLIRKYYKEKNIRSINLQFSSYIKEYAKKIGADFYAKDAKQSVEIAKQVLC